MIRIDREENQGTQLDQILCSVSVTMKERVGQDKLRKEQREQEKESKEEEEEAKEKGGGMDMSWFGEARVIPPCLPITVGEAVFRFTAGKTYVCSG